MTSREPMEPVDEEAGVLGNLEDVSESEQTQESADHTEEEKGDNPKSKHKSCTATCTGLALRLVVFLENVLYQQ